MNFEVRKLAKSIPKVLDKCVYPSPSCVTSQPTSFVVKFTKTSSASVTKRLPSNKECRQIVRGEVIKVSEACFILLSCFQSLHIPSQIYDLQSADCCRFLSPFQPYHHPTAALLVYLGSCVSRCNLLL